MRQNGEKMSENNDTINNQEEEYEKICYICRRPESKAGKMIAMPGNVYVCQDCLQKTFDTINNSGMNYDDMMKMSGMPNMGMFGNMNYQDMDIPENQKIKKKKKVKKPEEKLDLFRRRTKLSICSMNMWSDRTMQRKSCRLLFTITIKG